MLGGRPCDDVQSGDSRGENRPRVSPLPSGERGWGREDSLPPHPRPLSPEYRERGARTFHSRERIRSMLHLLLATALAPNLAPIDDPKKEAPRGLPPIVAS